MRFVNKLKNNKIISRFSVTITISFILLFWNFNPVQAQDNAHFELWNSFHSKYFVSKYRFWYQNDFSIRASFSDDPSTLYILGPRMVINLGNYLEFLPAVDFRYTHFYQSDNSFELRTWQGLAFHWPQIKRVLFDHFYRFEQRFIWDNGVYQGDVSLRSRYRLNTRIPLNNRAIFEKTFYLDIRGEVFIPHDDGVDETFASTIRLGLNLGYNYNPKWRYYATVYADFGSDSEGEERTASRYILSLNVRGTF